jgi:hypothetical protein
MANDNTLGAPTEGLGQTVTFAFNPPSTPQDSGGSYGGVRVGMSGGTVNPGATNVMRVEPKKHPLVEKLLAMTDTVAAQQLKQKQTEAYVGGMSRVAQGEAVADIVKEQPWYANLFGPSDVVEGARAYASRAQVAKAMAVVEETMPTLAALGPDEAKAHFTKIMNDHLTGDSATDANLLVAFGEAMPGPMKRQAKEHYGYLQYQMNVQQGAAWREKANEVQKAAVGFAMGSYTEDEFTAKQDALEAFMLPAPGQTDESHAHNVSSFLIDQAQAGNLHVINFLRRGHDGVSILDTLPSDKRTTVEKAVEAGENRMRMKYSFDWSNDLAEIETQAALPQEGETARSTANRVDAINARYNKTTGSDAGLITPAHKAALVSGSAEKIIREKQRQAAELAHRLEKEADKKNNDAEKAAALAKLNTEMRVSFRTGHAGLLANTPGIERKKVDAEILDDWKGMGPLPGGMMSPTHTLALANNMKSNYVNMNIQDMLQGQIKSQMTAGADITPSFENAVNNYRALYLASPSAAAAYYGDYAGKIEGYIQDTDAQIEPKLAYQNNFILRKKPGPVSDKDRQAATKAVGESSWRNIARTVGMDDTVKLQPSQDGILSRMLAPAVDAHRASGRGLESATAAAFAAKQATGAIEIIGGFVIENDPSSQKRVYDSLTGSAGPNGAWPVGKDTIHDMFYKAVSQKIVGDSKEAWEAKDMDELAVIRQQDSGKELNFYITALKDGKPYRAYMSSSEVYAQYEKYRNRETPRSRVQKQREEEQKTPVGTPLPSRPNERVTMGGQIELINPNSK